MASFTKADAASYTSTDTTMTVAAASTHPRVTAADESAVSASIAPSSKMHEAHEASGLADGGDSCMEGADDIRALDESDETDAPVRKSGGGARRQSTYHDPLVVLDLDQLENCGESSQEKPPAKETTRGREQEDDAFHSLSSSSSSSSRDDNNDGGDDLSLFHNFQHVPVPVGGMRRVSSCYFSIASNLSELGREGSFHNLSDLQDLDEMDWQGHGNMHGHGHHDIEARNNFGINHQSEYFNKTENDCKDKDDALEKTSNASIVNRSTATAINTPEAATFEQSPKKLTRPSAPSGIPNVLYNHDVLMNIFTYLHDATTLAKVSIISKRLNFECFYFLELQLQRALLVHPSSAQSNGAPNAATSISATTNTAAANAKSTNAEDLPSIPGTGVISRLAKLDSQKARDTVQTYLNSNGSIRGMPLSYSLAYIRQVFCQHAPPNMNFNKLMTNQFSYYYNNRRNNAITDGRTSNDNISNNRGRHDTAGSNSHHDNTNYNTNNTMAKNARNMALVLTFLGAAYMHQQNGGGDMQDMLPSLPDPEKVLHDMMTSESMAVLRDALFKVGLAGGLVKAGVATTMKKKEEERLLREQQGQGRREEERGDYGESAQGDEEVEGDADDDDDGEQERETGGLRRRESNDSDGNLQQDRGSERGDQISDENDGRLQRASPSDAAFNILSTLPTALTSRATVQVRDHRSSSLGSLEDLSHMLPTSIATRLCKVFSNNSNDSSNSAGNAEDNARKDSARKAAVTEKKHRDKRSHTILRKPQKEYPYGEEKKSSFYDDYPEYSDSSIVSTRDQHINDDVCAVQEEKESPESIEYAMEHPFSPNPYDHVSKPNGPNDSNHTAPIDSKLPSGCIGAYARAVKTAAAEVTRLVKEERKANFDALPEEERIQLGVRFIDACSSDSKLSIVKDILQKQKIIDVDCFFIGPDETETCALHAAAFNGADEVLKFLCGGIDERDPSKDGGLCNVDIRDANGWTALHFAAGANSVSSVRILAEHGAKLTIEAGNGYTPYHWAERLSNEEVAAEMERLGADNRFVGRWMFGGGASSLGSEDRKVPFVSFLANKFFSMSR